MNTKHTVEMLFYGMIVASVIIAISWFVLPHSEALMGARLFAIQGLGQDLSSDTIVYNFQSLYDGGIVWYYCIIIIGSFFGVKTAAAASIVTQMMGMWLLIAAYPLIIRNLFQSRNVAVASPWVLGILAWAYYLHWLTVDYWFMGWCIFFCVPLLVLLYRTQSWKARWGLFVFICCISGISNVARGYSETGPILLAALIILLHIKKSGRACLQSVLTAVLVLLIGVLSHGFFAQTLPACYIQ